MWLAFGGAALLLVAGLVIARLYPSRAPREVAAALAAAGPADGSPPAMATPSDHRTLTVGSPAAIANTLLEAGIAADVAHGAAREVTSVLGATPGDVHLAIDLAGPASGRELTRLEAMRDNGGVVLTARADGSYTSEPVPARLTTGM